VDVHVYDNTQGDTKNRKPSFKKRPVGVKKWGKMRLDFPLKETNILTQERLSGISCEKKGKKKRGLQDFDRVGGDRLRGVATEGSMRLDN